MSVVIDYILPILGIVLIIYLVYSLAELNYERQKEHDRFLTENILKLIDEKNNEKDR